MIGFRGHRVLNERMRIVDKRGEYGRFSRRRRASTIAASGVRPTSVGFRGHSRTLAQPTDESLSSADVVGVRTRPKRHDLTQTCLLTKHSSP
jgi:hypothetical protein